LLEKLNKETKGEIIILGGYAKLLNGYVESYEKNWIDIAIPPSSVEVVKKLGKYLPLPNGTDFPHPIIEQFLVKIEPNWVLDCFVQDTSGIDWWFKDDLRVLTPKGDIEYHQRINRLLESDYITEKILAKRELYNIW